MVLRGSAVDGLAPQPPSVARGSMCGRLLPAEPRSRGWCFEARPWTASHLSHRRSLGVRWVAGSFLLSLEAGGGASRLGRGRPRTSATVGRPWARSVAGTFLLSLEAGGWCFEARPWTASHLSHRRPGLDAWPAPSC